MKKQIIYVSIVFIIISFIVIRVNGYNTIKTNSSMIKRISVEDEYGNDLSLIDSKVIDDRTVVLFSNLNQIGIAEFSCIIGCACKIENVITSTYNDLQIFSTVLDTNKSPYIVIYGKTSGYSEISFELEDFDYIIPLPFNEEYFIVYHIIPDNSDRKAEITSIEMR